MDTKKLAMLGMIAVVMASAAFLLERFKRGQKPANIEVAPIIEGLDIESVREIRILSNGGQEKVTLKRVGKNVLLEEKEGYTADPQKWNTLVNNCVDLRVTSDSWITSSEENFETLGLTDQTARYQIEFFNKDQELITGILVSESKPEQDNISYARLVNDKDVYAVRDVPWFSTRPTEYLQNLLFEVPREKIIRVSVTDPNGVTYTLKSLKDSQQITLDSMPAGKQFKGTAYSQLFHSLNSLRINDVFSEKSFNKAPSFPWEYVCELSDSVVYTVSLAKTDQKGYLKVGVKYTGPEPSVQKEVESEEQLKEREARFLARDGAATFSQKHTGWVYQIASYKADEMAKALEDLLEPIPEETEEKAESETIDTPSIR